MRRGDLAKWLGSLFYFYTCESTFAVGVVFQEGIATKNLAGCLISEVGDPSLRSGQPKRGYLLAGYKQRSKKDPISEIGSIGKGHRDP